jgi:hypothetical protein
MSQSVVTLFLKKTEDCLHYISTNFVTHIAHLAWKISHLHRGRGKFVTCDVCVVSFREIFYAHMSEGVAAHATTLNKSTPPSVKYSTRICRKE